MIVISTVSGLNSALQPVRCNGDSIGFVPTMGALHEGHATLIRQSITENECTVVSLFVNPTQFNNSDDLRLYPRTPEGDQRLLEQLGVDFLFAPSEEEVYPEPDRRQFDFGMLDKVMEGRYRPGHFNGVAQVVSRLFSYVQPDKAYFGEKDFQQLAIVRTMTSLLHIPVEIVGVPTVREPSGLAMSSRNLRLSDEERQKATNIFQVLSAIKTQRSNKTVAELTSAAEKTLLSNGFNKVDYVAIADSETLELLEPGEVPSNNKPLVALVAAFMGEVRLIDNTLLT